MSFSEDLKAPKWLNSNFFQQVLQEYLSDPQILVHKISFQPASKPGDHFASDMFKVTIHYDSPKDDSQDLSKVVVVKTVPIEDGFKKVMVNYDRLFRTEIRVYEQVIPAMEELLRTAGDDTKIAPTLIYQSMEPNKVLILEDLCSRGFEMSDGLLGLHGTLMVVEKLAKFHASSMILNNDKGMCLTDIKSSYFHFDREKDFDIPRHTLVPGVKLFIEAVKDRPDYIRVKAIPALENFANDLVVKLEEIYTNQENKPWTVLSHSDFHRKNLMFKKSASDSSEYDDYLIFDYQFCVWTTPTVDLYYVLYQVADANTRVHYRSKVIEYYHTSLKLTLEKLKYTKPIPSLDELEQDLLVNGAAEVMQALCFLKYQYMDWKGLNINEELKKDRFFMTKKVLQDENFLNVVAIEVKRFLQLGILK